ncbi:MAG: hypothetical protein U5N55_01645 [Cypionkella sp.]|nr:hypothetical protein [Cypionkella sp.]
MQTRKWQDQSGADRYTTEIVLQGPNCVMQMLDGKSSGDTQQPDDHAPQKRGADLDDEIPF